MNRELLIVGASARAAAQSARRAGFQPYAVDMFGDVDLQQACSTRLVKDYPSGVEAAVNEFPRCPWMYTGGLENHPRIIDAISERRPLLGNPGSVTRRVRDPWQLTAEFRERGLLVPELATSTLPSPAGNWLVKPLRSAGGLSVRPLADVKGWGVDSRNYYLQRFIPGTPAGAVFFGAGRQTRLLGVTKQLVGIEGLASRPFVYRGSIGPLDISNSIRKQLHEIGNCLAIDFGLRGLFGVDVILDGEDVWTIEVNPRYAASVEVLERALNFQAIQLHVECFDKNEVEGVSLRAQQFCGKEIVYAKSDLVIVPRFLDIVAAMNAGLPWPRVADIPAVGTRISAGHPICTVFTAGELIAEVENGLLSLKKSLQLSAPTQA